MIEFTVAFLGVFFLTFLLRPISNRIGLVDRPTTRKQHNGEIPLIGGIAMFASCSVAALFFVPHSSDMTYLVAACGLLVMTGSIDDKYDIHYRIRLCVQTICAAMLIWGANTQLMSFGNIFGSGELNLWWFSIPITLVAVVGMINAYNMIDGIDGLSGGLSLISSIGLYFLIAEKISDGATNILLLMIGALSAYLILNLHIFPKWTTIVFMGDAGSMLIGFVITAFLIRYSQSPKQIIMPVTALWLAAVPLMDIFVTSIRRLKQGKNPFHPDRTHIHHIFLRAGFKKEITLLIILLFQAFTVAIGVYLESIGIAPLSALAFMALFLIYLKFIKHSFRVAKLLRRYSKK
jgi:UDP-GlcNAc:undecaprenyl-phosphate GlcNAc-1-phosphate transferase